MTRRIMRLLTAISSAGLMAGAIAGGLAPGAAAASAGVALAGTGGPRTQDAPASDPATDATSVEFPGGPADAAVPSPYSGTIVDRSNRSGDEGRESGGDGEGGDNGLQATVLGSFDGLNHYQQRYARRGNQFSLEPPDQGLCVGNGYVVEAVNDVFNVYDAAGNSRLPDNTSTNVVAGFPRNVNHAVDLNSFYGYPPAVNRSTGIRGQFVTDPTCLYDAATQRFFLVVLTLETVPTTGRFTHVNHLDIAVSKTSDPTGSWNIYRKDVTMDGSNPDPSNACPCLGDYPHIGADANGFYVTTNSYPWKGNGFDGAQIYAFSKAQLAAGLPVVNMQHIDTFGMVAAPSDAGATQPGFTVWPAQSPGADSFDRGAGGTEYFLSSNAADEATHPIAGTGGTYVSNQIIEWALTNTGSLNTVPNVHLSNRVFRVGTYALPPSQHQPGAGAAPDTGVPQGHCLNDSSTVTIAGPGCWRLLVGAKSNEVVSRPDSNDTRMQQVTFADGLLWGALDTALSPGGGAQQAGIAWYAVQPRAGRIANQGYLGAAGVDFAYPAIGVTAEGKGVMAFTATGSSLFPSAAYATIDAEHGPGSWHVVAAGQASDDGFTGYKAQVGNPPRPRWGDYGAAAVDGNNIWIASEYIASACSYTDWGGPFFAGGTGDNLLGTCAGASHGPGKRTALANWATRISELTFPED